MRCWEDRGAIVGYMEDGGLLLDAHLTERKRVALEKGIRDLVPS